MGEGNLHGFTPSCSVVICTRDRPELLNRCLDAVSRLTYPKFDVLVVDNAPKDARAWEIAKRWGTQYMIEPVLGVSRVRNCGAFASDGEIVAYLDDDFEPEPGWLKALALEFADPKVMAVAGQICALETEAETNELPAAILGLYIGGPDRRVADRMTPSWFELTNFGGITPGGNMAFRRSAFEVWPGFDERLGRGALLLGGEEHYAFFSLVDRGYRVVYTPHAVVRHPLPRNILELRECYLKDLRAAIGYMTLLLVEKPCYRRATLKYILEGVKGVKRTWRFREGEPRPRIVPWWRMMIAYLYGPLLYIRSRYK
jgi:glycosyltransferase involved in cell wall biosynthesis